MEFSRKMKTGTGKVGTGKTGANKTGISKTKHELTAQKSIPFERMFKDGTCRVSENYYTKTVCFQDRTYHQAKEEVQRDIFDDLCSVLNFFDSSICVELSFVNRRSDKARMRAELTIPFKGDFFDPMRTKFSEILYRQEGKGNGGIEKKKYLTFGVRAASMKQARSRLLQIERDILGQLRQMKVSASGLKGKERLALMHSIFHLEEKVPFLFDWKELEESGLSPMDYIAPTSFAFDVRSFQMGETVGAMSYLAITASKLCDELLMELLSMNCPQVVTIQIMPVEQSQAIRTVKHTITELDSAKIDEQKKAVRDGYDMDVLPSDLTTYGNDAKVLLRELQEQNERMFLVTVLLLHTGKTKQEVETAVFQAKGIAQKYNCDLRRLDFQQEQGLMSSLPLAQNLIKINRGLTTSSTGILIPFANQELYQPGKGALYYGVNQETGVPVIVDRKYLKTPNGVFLGTSGSGKSFAAKREMINAFLSTDDDILICDPEGEYAALVNRFDGQVVKISAASTSYINPMDVHDNYSEEDNPVALKAEFILSFIEIVMGTVDAVERSAIDRCVNRIYQRYFADPEPEKMPVLGDLYEELLRMDSKAARHVADSLELYVNGSLKLFNHRTNVDIHNRLVCFDIKELGKQLKQLGMLVIQDQVWSRVSANRDAGKFTRYYADEFHLLLKEPQTAAYSVEIWKRFRKWGGIPTGITQNSKDLLTSPEITNILENSDFLYLLNQGSDDRDIVKKRLNLSPKQLAAVTNSAEGEGLLFFGDVVLSVADHFPKDNELYRIMSTKATENRENGQENDRGEKTGDPREEHREECREDHLGIYLEERR